MTDTTHEPDRAILEVGRSLIEAARTTWPHQLIREPNAPGHPRELYTETHLALACVLLAQDADDGADLLDFAAERLTLWDEAGGPMTFFNSMAVFLALLQCRANGLGNTRLEAVFSRLLDRTTEHESVAWDQWCGNNAYLQQVMVDTVLLPLARGEDTVRERIAHLVSEFDRFRTPEGFLNDLPRHGDHRQKLYPPTYIMKMYFLLGVAHELTEAPDLAERFDSGMLAALPLLSRDGQFGYFGRTDNSPFAAGLTLFNLRRALHFELGGDKEALLQASIAAEDFYQTFPRNENGLLRCNRFAAGETPEEFWRSQDGYAYDGQYSLSSAAYAMLAVRWYPRPETSVSSRAPTTSATLSGDLGVVRLRAAGTEVLVRTGSEITAWDRRYLGPTVLRMATPTGLAVGAISTTVSSDWAMQPRPANRIARVLSIFNRRRTHGFDDLDATSAGFVPVLRVGTRDYVFDTLVEQQWDGDVLHSTHTAVSLPARGWWPLWSELWGTFRNRVSKWLGPVRYTPLPVVPAPGVELRRQISIEGGECRVVDSISGAPAGATLRVAARLLPDAGVRVEGLQRAGVLSGWGSDGVHRMETFEAGAGVSCSYEITILMTPPTA